MAPKVLGFIFVMAKDSLGSRYFYKVLLRIILVFMIFVLPIFYLNQIKKKYIPHYCDGVSDLHSDVESLLETDGNV